MSFVVKLGCRPIIRREPRASHDELEEVFVTPIQLIVDDTKQWRCWTIKVSYEILSAQILNSLYTKDDATSSEDLLYLHSAQLPMSHQCAGDKNFLHSTIHFTPSFSETVIWGVVLVMIVIIVSHPSSRIIEHSGRSGFISHRIVHVFLQIEVVSDDISVQSNVWSIVDMFADIREDRGGSLTLD